MSKLLVVENELDRAREFLELLSMYDEFDVEVVHTYENAKALLKRYRYEFGVADVELDDAPNGEIIPLFNKYNISPLIYTDTIDEGFLETYESSFIVDYALKSQRDSTYLIINKLRQLVLNKQTKILIISNSQTYTQYLKQNLAMHNFQIIIAKNSAETLEKIKLHPELNLIITEYDLPFVNGLELVKKIRKLKTKKKLKILTLTNNPESEITLSFLSEGADDYLVKPFSRAELYESIYKNVQII